MKNIVIFGSSGFIGDKLFEYLQTKKCTVQGYSSKDCNLLDKKQVKKVVDCFSSETTIVYCSSIGRLKEDSINSLSHNIEMLNNLLGQVSTTLIRHIIYLSSVDIYGFPEEDKLPITETTFPDPVSFYGLSKLINEETLRFFPNLNRPVTILRLPGIYGSGTRENSLISNFTKKILDDKEIVLSGNGSTIREFTEINDLCEIVHCFVENPFNGTLNVASGERVIILKLAEMIYSVCQKEPKIKFNSIENDRNGNLCFDNSKIMSLLPDFAFKKLNDGIRDFVDLRLKKSRDSFSNT